MTSFACAITSALLLTAAIGNGSMNNCVTYHRAEKLPEIMHNGNKSSNVWDYVYGLKVSVRLCISSCGVYFRTDHVWKVSLGRFFLGVRGIHKIHINDFAS